MSTAAVIKKRKDRNRRKLRIRIAAKASFEKNRLIKFRGYCIKTKKMR